MKYTQRDGSQIERYEHDENVDAKRVIIVGGLLGDIKLDANVKMDKVEELLSELNKKESGKVIIQESRIEKVEVPVIVKETSIERVEIPTIILQKEVVIEKIEVPVIVKETVIQTIEIPVIKEIKQSLEFPKIIGFALIGQTIIGLGILIALLIK